MSIIDKFLEFEHKNKLFEQKVDGVRFWHYLRFTLYNEIVDQKEKTGRAHVEFKHLSIAIKAVRFFNMIYGAIFRNPFWLLRKKDILVMNHARRGKVGNYYEALYTDRLLQSIPYSYTFLENPYQGHHLKPVKTKHLRYKDYIDVAQELVKNVYYKPFRRHLISEDEALSFSVVLKNLEADFQVKLPVVVWQTKIQNIIWNYRVHKRYFKKIIKRVKPKIILEVVSYSVNRGVMNELAFELGIPTVELQHGTMGEGHLAYNFLEKFDLPSFPKYVFLFGEFWKETTRFPISNENIFVTGSPYFEERLAKYVAKKVDVNKKKTILFVSQGTIGFELSRTAVDLANKVDLSVYKIVYKLHPGEYDGWEISYPDLASANLEVIDSNYPEMYDLFKTADYLIGVYSTAIFEALPFCNQVFIVKLFGYQRMSQLYDNGFADLIADASEIIDLLNRKYDATSNDNFEYFWEKNSLENMSKAITKLMI